MTTPHPLDGPVVKVAIARDHIESLHFDTQRFFARTIGGAPVGKLNKRSGVYRLKTPDEVDIPISWAVRVGEIAHDLRSALDQLVCQLAIISGPDRDAGFCQRKRTEFPVFIRGPRSAAPSRFRRAPLMSYLKPSFVTRIQRAQPYFRPNGGSLSPLWLLHELNNMDKRRLIVIVGGWVLGTASEAAPRRSHIRTIGMPGGQLRTPIKVDTKPPGKYGPQPDVDALPGAPDSVREGLPSRRRLACKYIRFTLSRTLSKR